MGFEVASRPVDSTTQTNVVKHTAYRASHHTATGRQNAGWRQMAVPCVPLRAIHQRPPPFAFFVAPRDVRALRLGHRIS